MSFVFKQFKIRDTHSGMKVGTDGVLLGAWASIPPHGSSVLDVGCGSGIVSLIVAQRMAGDVKIDAIDIDEGAVTDARHNFYSSSWSSSFTALCDNFVNYSQKTDKRYDLIISNPPFYTQETLSPDAKRSIARNTSSLTFNDLFCGATALLARNGTFALITPMEAYDDIARTALLNRLYLQRMTKVVTVEGTEPKRVLTEWGMEQFDFDISTLIISHKSGEYTKEYRLLTESFYEGVSK